MEGLLIFKMVVHLITTVL